MQRFGLRMHRRAGQLESGVKRTKEQAMMAVAAAVIGATPADTGQARSNWTPGVRRPNRSTRPPYSPGSKLGLSETGNASAALSRVRATISKSGAADDLWLSNNLDYIGDLNLGKSKQAPPRYVQKAVQQAVQVVKGARVFR